MTLPAGTTIGRFQILAQLGKGGMATVYKAFQPSLDRTVALKVLHPGISESPEMRERFDREAKAIARLQHPNIIQVFDFDTVDGHSFLVMELVDGGTLKAKLVDLARTGQRLPLGEASRIVREVGEALDAAHNQGIVHRDVKPSNILLTTSGKAVVADFGIARIIAGAQQTQTGVGVGTPEYMSPEQSQGLEIDHRSDIYSLGIMAYELVTGRVPFSADTPLAVVLSHVRDPLPLPSKIDPSIGPSIEQALLKATAKDPAARYGKASEFGAALASAVANPTAVATQAVAANPTPVPTTVAAAPAATSEVAPARSQGVERAAVARKSKADAAAKALLRRELAIVTRVVGIAFLILEIALLARFVLKLAAVGGSAPLIAAVYAFTEPFVAPFHPLEPFLTTGIVPELSGGRIIEVAALLALVVWFAVSRGIDALANRMILRYTVSRY